MATHFNAFISYRHSPLDSQIAQRIHRQLERFKIPKAIKKATGIKKIDRIFRDKEELPLSRNLSDDINEALLHSDFLIVVCTPRFQQSQWCLREIELFLQTHPVEQILIVLAEGEPDDVVPPILMQDREPLCCDYRMKPNKAKNIELPRLVSAILGCRYDDLRQRQRQYKMRRMVALFSSALAASLALTAYFINTSIQIQRANDDLHAANVQISEANVKIQDNLDQALRNQSQYLASSSQERMEAGDRMTAIVLAMEALPEEGEDRPYLGTAEYALSQALSSYQVNDELVAQGTYAAENLVKNFVLTEEGGRIYVLDVRNILTVWDVDTFEKLHTVDAGRYRIDEMYLTPQGNMIFLNDYMDKEAVCVDLEGRELWRVEETQDLGFLDERSVVMLLQYDYMQLHQIQFLDTDTGEPVREPMPLEKGADGSYGIEFLQREYVSGQPVLLRYYASNAYSLAFAEPETDSLRIVKTLENGDSGETRWIDGAGVTQEGNVVAMCGDGSGYYNGTYGNREITGLDRADIWCFDGKTGQLLWENEIVTYMYSSDSVVLPIPDSNWMLMQSGNTFLVCDSSTGEEIARNQTTALPLSVKVSDTSAVGVLKNGDYYIFNFTNNSCSSVSMIDGNVDMAEGNNGFFVHMPLGTQVTAYWMDEESYTDGTVFDFQIQSTVRFQQVSGDNMVLKTYNTLYVLDARQQKLRWSTEIGYGWQMIGFSDDGSEFWMFNDSDDYAAAISMEDFSIRELELPAKLGDAYTLLESNMYLKEDKVLYMLEAEEALHLIYADLRTGETLLDRSLEALLPEETEYTDNSKILLATDTYIWIYRDDGVLYVLDMESGNAKVLAEELLLTPPVVFSPDHNQVMVGIDHELRLTTPGGALIGRIDLEERKAVTMHFYNRDLLVLCDDGDLYRYDRNGKLLSQTALHIFNTFGQNATSEQENPAELNWWETADGDIILNAFRAGNLVDTGTWQTRAFVPYLLSYVESNDTLLTQTDYTVVSYPRYSTAQQMERGREKLGNFRLSREQQDYYGLSNE